MSWKVFDTCLYARERMLIGLLKNVLFCIYMSEANDNNGAIQSTCIHFFVTVNALQLFLPF